MPKSKPAPKKTVPKKTAAKKEVKKPPVSKKTVKPVKHAAPQTPKPVAVAEKVMAPPAKKTVVAAEKTKQKVDLGLSGRYYYGSGHRKSSIAQVQLYKGTGRIFINDKEASVHRLDETQMGKVYAPLVLVGQRKNFDISVRVQGGGMSGQAEAIRHGIARALLMVDPELRVTLKKAGLLTRDSRVKERKKYGLHRARRAPQWAKR